MSTNAETHHYIKNILQSILSYTNTAVVNSVDSPIDNIKKIQQYIYILSSVQDLVFANNPLDYKGSIRADRVIHKAAMQISRDEDLVPEEFPELTCYVKRAANLALIFLEMFYTVKRHTSGAMAFNMEEISDKQFTISISGENISTTSNINDENLVAELKLAGMLLKSDLNGTFKFDQNNSLKIIAEFSVDN